MIRYIQLVYFTEIVERGSISAAARSLYVSQSALSQSVAGLEEELGAELIRRSKNGVRLSWLGHRVYRDAKRIISTFRECETGWRALLSERESLSGQVRILCTPGVEEYLSESVVPELSDACPGVELLISPSPEMRLGFRSFLDSGCAIGIGACLSEAWEATRSGAERAGLVCEEICREYPQVLLSARNPLSQGDSLSREQLGQLELVCYSNTPPPRFLPLFRGTAARVPNKASVLRLVAGSESAAVFAPSSVGRTLSGHHGRLRLLPLSFRDEAFLPVVHYLIHAPEDRLTPPERRTLELVRCYPYGGQERQ